MAKVKKVLTTEQKKEMEAIDDKLLKYQELAKHGGYSNIFICPFCKKDHSASFDHNLHFRGNLDVICECGAKLRFVTNYEVLTISLELPHDWMIGGN